MNENQFDELLKNFYASVDELDKLTTDQTEYVDSNAGKTVVISKQFFGKLRRAFVGVQQFHRDLVNTAQQAGRNAQVWYQQLSDCRAELDNANIQHQITAEIAAELNNKLVAARKEIIMLNRQCAQLKQDNDEIAGRKDSEYHTRIVAMENEIAELKSVRKTAEELNGETHTPSKDAGQRFSEDDYKRYLAGNQ